MKSCHFNQLLTDDKGGRPITKTQRRLAQSVTFLATDACLTADPGVPSLIPALYYTVLEIDHEKISTGFLLLSAELIIQEGLLSVTSESMCTKYMLTTCLSLPRKKVWLGELTIP